MQFSHIIKAFLVISLSISYLQADEQFIMPPQNLWGQIHYHEMCWLSTHNAYAAERYGFLYANQYYTLKEQLERGVRAFELDIDKRCWSKALGIFGGEGCTVSLCHASCELTKWMQPKASGLFESTGDPNGLKTTALDLFKKWLEEHPNDIITITFENRVTLNHGADYKDLDKQFKDAGLDKLTLKPTDWNPDTNKGWPTIEWMIKNNKRLVAFNDASPSDQGYPTNLPFTSSEYTYYQWAVMAQNQWGGSKDVNIALKERGSSKNQSGRVRYLYELDWFPEGGKIIGGGLSDIINKLGSMADKETPFGGDFNKYNGPELENFLKRAYNEGLNTGIGRERLPNFIKVDYFHEGYPMRQVNNINKRSFTATLEERAKLFRPIGR